MEPFLERTNLTLLGDFNFHLDDTLCKDTQILLETFSSWGCSQRVRSPTHVARHILDGIFSNDPRVVVGEPIPLAWSDHFAVPFDLCSLTSQRDTPETRNWVERRDFSRISKEALSSFFNCLQFSGYQDANLAAANLSQQLSLAMDTLAPVRKHYSARRSPSAPWFSESFRMLRQKCRRQERLWRSDLEPLGRELHKKYLKEYKVAIMEEKRSYYS